MPIISVILPVYNGDRFIKEAVESILAQTFTDLELIIIDDCSVDSTPLILQQYVAQDPRVRVMQQPRNLGIVECLNMGCRIASGQYLARMDADDISLPERLEKQLTYFNINSHVGVVGTNAQQIDELGKKQAVIAFPSDPIQIYWSMAFYNPIVHPTVMMRRDLFFQVGGYRAGYPEDYDLWRRVARQAHLSNLPEVLLLLRKHPMNLSMIHEVYSPANSIRVASELMADVLERHISEKIVEVLHNPKCVEEEQRWQAAVVLEKFARVFLQKFSPSQDEKSFIVRDTTERLMSLALRKLSIRAILLMLRAIGHSPRVVFRMLLSHWWNVKNRMAVQ